MNCKSLMNKLYMFFGLFLEKYYRHENLSYCPVFNSAHN